MNINRVTVNIDFKITYLPHEFLNLLCKSNYLINLNHIYCLTFKKKLLLFCKIILNYTCHIIIINIPLQN